MMSEAGAMNAQQRLWAAHRVDVEKILSVVFYSLAWQFSD